MKNRILFFSFLIIHSSFVLGQNSSIRKNVNWEKEANIELAKFSSFQIARSLSSAQTHDEHVPLDNRLQLVWRIDGQKYHLDLFRNNIFGENHFILDERGQKREIPDEERPVTYAGSVNGQGQVRLTFKGDFVAGTLLMGTELWYIEMANKFNKHFLQNDVILYKAKDIVSQSEFVCGVNDKLLEKRKTNSQESRSVLNTTSGTSICRKIEVAQAYESGIVTRYGNPGTSTWNTAIWNTVNGFYSGLFSEDVFFEIAAEFYNAPIAFPNTGSPAIRGCITTYLTNFQTWGEGGGFGAGVTFDIGNLWTSENVTGCARGSGGVIGSVMDIPGVCGSTRYQIFEDFVGPTDVPPVGNDLANLAVLIAHESGHNIGMFHNNPAGANIMEPFINVNANSFSERSLHYYRSTALNVSCYSSCNCIEVVQAIPINCSTDGSVFDVMVTVEHENISGSFSVEMGAISQIAAYGSNPQIVTLSSVPSGTTSITVTDIGDPTCTFTTSMVLPTAANFTGVVGDPYCIDDLPVNQTLTSTFSESFGSIIIDLNGDDFSTDEQSAQILNAQGNVVVDYPRGTFANNANVTLNSGMVLIADGPYTVQVSDWFGDGLGSAACQATNGGPGDYEIRDGLGNIIRAAAGLQNVTGSDGQPCTGNNASLESTTSIIPAVELISSGNYSGNGVTDGTADDGIGDFNVTGLNPETHLINYVYQTQIGCSATQMAVQIYDTSSLSLGSVTCTSVDNFEAQVGVNLGDWNSILSGEATGISVSSGGVGTLSTSSITADGTITISAIPDGSPITLTIGDGSENGGCQTELIIAAPSPSCNILPVELISFEGYHQDRVNYLTWITASEINNKGFEILRSENGINFEIIGWAEGRDDSENMQEYFFKDRLYGGIINYYQLRQIDFDAAFELSHIIKIENAESNMFSVFQNPFDESISAFLHKDVESLSIINTLGQSMFYISNPEGNLIIDTSDWPPALYHIISKNEGRKFFTEVVKY